jgi:hypothetical protein
MPDGLASVRIPLAKSPGGTSRAKAVNFGIIMDHGFGLANIGMQRGRSRMFYRPIWSVPDCAIGWKRQEFARTHGMLNAVRAACAYCGHRG